jgi:outer membrane receptor for Fe3+-dicitrate
MEGMSFLNKKYFSNIVYMEIAERDRKFLMIKNAMKANQEHILQKLKKLEKTKNENEFLNTIYDDYKRYHTHMLEEKKRQKWQLELLVQYLEMSMRMAGLTENSLQKAKHEQMHILSELDKVRDELNTMVHYKD